MASRAEDRSPFDHRPRRDQQGPLADSDYGSVIALLGSAPFNQDLVLDLALAYGKSGMLDQASRTLTEALGRTPQFLALDQCAGHGPDQTDPLSGGLPAGAENRPLHPQDLEAGRLYLRVLVLNDDMAKAQPLGRRLLARAPHDPDLLYLNGIIESRSRPVRRRP